MQERLLEMGAWLKVNGEAIYGTRHAGRDCQWTEGKRPDQTYGSEATAHKKVPYNLMEMVGQAPRDGRVSAVEQTPQQFRRVAQARQHQCVEPQLGCPLTTAAKRLFRIGRAGPLEVLDPLAV